MLREELSGQALRNQGRALSSETGRTGERWGSPSQVLGLVWAVPWYTELGLDYLWLDHSVQTAKIVATASVGTAILVILLAVVWP